MHLTRRPGRSLTAAALLAIAATAPAAAQARPAQTRATGHFAISSPDIKPGARVPERHVMNSFGCSGQNESPALRWTGAPAGAKSFAVTVYDPDAPTGSGFWHWVVYNIPANVTELPAGAGAAQSTSLPAGAVQGINDTSSPSYAGPCPPKGDKPHRYIFTVYALKAEHLDLPPNATPAFVGFNLHGNLLAKATFTARYGR